MRPIIWKILLGITALGAGYWLGSSPRVGLPSTAASGASRAASATASAAESKEEAVNSAASALLNRGIFRELAKIGELLDSLDPSQLGALADKLDRMHSDDREVLLPRFIAYWAKRDPQAATKWMEPRLAGYAKERWFGSGFATFETNLVNAWAENAPEQAFDYARRHAGTGLSGIIMANAIHHWPDKDDLRRFEVLRSFPAGKDRQKAMISFCFTWAQTDCTRALATAKTLPIGPERDGALCEILANLAYKQPTLAFEQATVLGVANAGVMSVLLKQASKQNPGVAADWLAKNSPELVSDLGVIVVESWAGTDPLAAFQWATEHGVPLTESTSRAAGKMPEGIFLGHRMELGGNSPLSTAIRDKPEATVAWLQSLPTGPERDRYTEYVISYAQDMKTVLPLLSQLDGEAATKAAGKISASLYLKDPEQARSWAESLQTAATRAAAWAALGAQRTEPLDLPRGPDRDAMYSGMATGQYYSNPVKALEWTMQVDDPNLRRQTFDDVMALITKGDTQLGYNVRIHGVPAESRQKVQEWLVTAKVPEDWKQPWQQ